MSESEKPDDFEPQYQDGARSVEHRNIDSAGDHPFGSEPKEFTADMRALIRRVADDLYSSWEATIREYLANAETACLKVEEFKNNPSNSMYDSMEVEDSYQPTIHVTWDKQQEKLEISDNGIGMAAEEVDQIFRQIGRSSSRDDGGKSGNFGQGALSFVKFTGLDSAMIMTSHSRLNRDNASYYVTLAGVEPVRGSLPDDKFGTTFQMTPKEDFGVREAIEEYAEWMRVPVRYEEIDPNGEVGFQEDYGDKALYEAYNENRSCLGWKEDDCFEAYCSPDSDAQTLLLSMSIERNDGNHSPGQHGAPFPFDVRLLDESGKVVESSNGNEGLMPAVRSDYEDMLVEARDPYIPEMMLNNKDVIGQMVESGPNSGKMVVSDEDLNSGRPLPSAHDYVTKENVSPDDTPGKTQVIFGPNQGKEIISKEEWDEMDEGRAALYVPEDELEEYDVETGEGDLQLPQPTSDRDRLQSHPKFWKYVGSKFAKQFNSKVDEVYRTLDESEDALETIMELDEEELVVTPRGFGAD